MGQYFAASYQGMVYLSRRDAAGNPIATYTPGNVSVLKIALSNDVKERYEHQTGSRGLAHRLPTKKNASVSLSLDEITADNLALGFYGKVLTPTVGGTVTAVAPETLGTDILAVGRISYFANQGVSALTIKDSAATPVTLVAGTDYQLDPAFGKVTLLKTGVGAVAFVGPLKANYTYGAKQKVSIFTEAFPELHVRFEGVNTADANKRVLVELYRTAFNPLKEFNLINEDYNDIMLEGSLLLDPSKDPSTLTNPLGQFGSITYIDQ